MATRNLLGWKISSLHPVPRFQGAARHGRVPWIACGYRALSRVQEYEASSGENDLLELRVLADADDGLTVRIRVCRSAWGS